MFMNTAFLLDKGREVEFDHLMTDLGEKSKERSDYYYRLINYCLITASTIMYINSSSIIYYKRIIITLYSP